MRFGLRGLGVLLGFLIVVPAHVVALLAGKPDLIPPLFLGLMGRIAGLRIAVKGQPRPGALLIANHLSWLDVLALARVSRTRFVAHAGLTVHGGLKWLCDQNDTVFVTRDQRRTVRRQVAQVREALGARPLTIFPEGTTNDGTGLLPFRSSLLSAVEPLAHEVPVQPVALDYAGAPGIAWFGNEPGLANVRKILSRRGRVELTIHFLEPLEGRALTDRKSMATAARQAIAVVLEK